MRLIKQIQRAHFLLPRRREDQRRLFLLLSALRSSLQIVAPRGVLKQNQMAQAGKGVSETKVTASIVGLNCHFFYFYFFYLLKDLIRSPHLKKNEKIDFHGRGFLQWQTSLSITPAFSHPSLCALAKRHPRPKQCDLWEAFPPLLPLHPPHLAPSNPHPQSAGHFLFV